MIALIGERDIGKRAHAGIEASLELFRRESGILLPSCWIPTKSLWSENVDRVLSGVSAVWCTPGSPYENTAGALSAIRWARTQQVPFLGTCGGFQHALMEYCSAVLGRPAFHQEVDVDAAEPLIIKLACSLVEVRAQVIAPPGGWYAGVVGAAETTEEFHCNYGLAAALEPAFTGSDLEFVARDETGQVRAFRLATHPFFAGTLFQPERRALQGDLHPLVREFLRHGNQ